MKNILKIIFKLIKIYGRIKTNYLKFRFPTKLCWKYVLKIQIIILVELINYVKYSNYQNLLPILYIYFMSLYYQFGGKLIMKIHKVKYNI